MLIRIKPWPRSVKMTLFDAGVSVIAVIVGGGAVGCGNGWMIDCCALIDVGNTRSAAMLVAITRVTTRRTLGISASNADPHLRMDRTGFTEFDKNQYCIV